ncbi:MAG: hypothetical protein AAFZ52_04860 [Bacteroidota bacterium]
MKRVILFLVCSTCLLGIAAQGDNFSVRYDADGKVFRVANLEPPPESKQSGSKKTRWRIFWDFGDGHFAMQETKPNETAPSMEHNYATKGPHQVQVFLTPLYARYVAPAPAYTMEVNVPTGKQKTPKEKYEFTGKERVRISTDAHKEAIPGQTIRVAFGKQPRERGYLILFYNPIAAKDELNFDPFVIPETPGALPKYPSSVFVKQDWKTFEAAIKPKLDTGAMRRIGDKAFAEYGDRLIYQVVDADRANAFVSFTINKGLAGLRYLIEELSMAAIWVSDTGDFDPERDITELRMEVLKVHDPNRITVRPRKLFYKRRQPQDVTVKVTVKNVEDDFVDTAFLHLAVSKDLDVLGEDAIQIDYEKSEPQLELFAGPSNDPNAPSTVRWRTVPGKKQDSLIFTLRDIVLGKKEKAKLVFKLRSNKRRPRRSEIDGVVKFYGAEKPEPITEAKPSWRQKGLFLEVGTPVSYTSNRRYERRGFTREYTSLLERNQLTDNFYLALTRQNSPLENEKFYWDYGLRYTKVNMLSQESLSFLDTESEQIEAQYAGLTFSGGIKIKNLALVKGSVGLDLPLTLSRSFINAADSLRMSFNETDHGIFQDKPSTIGTARPVFFTSLSLELANSRTISGGARIRYFNRSETYRAKEVIDYCDGDFNFSECTYLQEQEVVTTRSTALELYLKIKLGTFGGKK